MYLKRSEHVHVTKIKSINGKEDVHIHLKKPDEPLVR